MNQLSLFDPPKDERPREINLEQLRRHLHNELYILRRADVMPWSEQKQTFKTKDFYYYSGPFPEAERLALVEEFERHMARLKAGAGQAA